MMKVVIMIDSNLRLIETDNNDENLIEMTDNE